MKNEEITLKNTKAEILEALNEALKREKNMESIKSNPEKEEKARIKEKAIEVSRENVEQKIFSEELNKKFKDLEIAIQAEEEKLKNLYGIEKELNNLTLVINAGKDCIAEIENNKKQKEEQLNYNIKELEEKYKMKSEELQKEYELKAKSLKIERDREVEEYTYKTKREREISNNKWEDEKKVREENLALKEATANKLLEEANGKVEQIKELETKVQEIPSLLEKEYARGKKETSDLLQRQYKYDTELLSKDFQNTIDRQNDKIESLREELNKANSLNETLQQKLDKAYLEIKEMATKTVEATGGVKILGNNQMD